MGTPAAIDRTRCDPGPGERSTRGGHVVRLHRDDRRLGRADRIEDRDTRELGTQHLTTLGHDLDDRELVRLRPSRGEQTAEQGLAHPSTADEEQACRHGARG